MLNQNKSSHLWLRYLYRGIKTCEKNASVQLLLVSWVLSEYIKDLQGAMMLYPGMAHVLRDGCQQGFSARYDLWDKILAGTNEGMKSLLNYHLALTLSRGWSKWLVQV